MPDTPTPPDLVPVPEPDLAPVALPQPAAEPDAEAPAEAPVEAAAETPAAPDGAAPDAPAAEGQTEAPAAPPSPAPPVPELSPAQCAAKLAALFPALFGQHQPQPLKLRIQADIQQRAPGLFTRKTLSLFLHRYTTGTPYLIALTKAPQRVDLDGAPAGEIAAEHREAATTELARRRGVVEARRAAENAARRQAEAAERGQRDAENQERRDRTLLLRAFETSTLTKANFCALKGLSEVDLDARLALARQEAAARPPAAPPEHRAAAPHPAGARRPDGPRRPEGQRRDGPRRDPRPPR